MDDLAEELKEENGWPAATKKSMQQARSRGFLGSKQQIGRLHLGGEQDYCNIAIRDPEVVISLGGEVEVCEVEELVLGCGAACLGEEDSSPRGRISR